MTNNNENNKPSLQFTELSPDDMAINENLCMDLLLDDNTLSLGEKGIKLMKAKRLFRKTFK